MTAVLLAQTAYQSSRTEIRSDRGTEYDAFAQITRSIQTAASEGRVGFAALARALHENRRLWTILAADVAGKENGLPAGLRAGIFYLAEFTEVQTRKILAGQGNADSLIDINRSVMRGLRGITEGVA